jgi:AcrR family transcriptional regulator
MDACSHEQPFRSAVESAIDLEILPPVPGMSAARRRLCVLALQLFSERGYDAVSIRDITDELGQQPGAFYGHARSKKELLFELMHIGMTAHRSRLREAVLDAPNDPVEQLRALMRAHVLVHLDYAELARLFAREMRTLDPEQQTALEAISLESRLELLAIIERGQARGVFAETDTYLVAVVLGDIGIRLPEWWTPESSRSREQIAQTYAEFALKLLS